MLLPLLLAIWTIGLTEFDRAPRLTIEADPGTAIRIRAGTREIILRHGETAGLLAVGDEIDLFARRRTSTARAIRVDAATGDAAFSIRSGAHRRRYRGVLEVKSAAGGLQALCRISDETAIAIIGRARLAAAAGRHNGFDFCDRVHCGFHLDPPSNPSEKH